MKAFPYAACVTLISLALAGCKPSADASYRYKLTISVETPEGMKTGSNVVELDYYKTASGAPHRTYGEALVLDIGASGTLVALLTQQGERTVWAQDDPISIIFKKCGRDTRDIFDLVDTVRSISACKAIYPLDLSKLSELPDILLFKNAKDLASLAVVDPENPEAVLGPGVVIRSASIQLTDEPLTRGVDDHLPWVRDWRGKIDPPLWHTRQHFLNSIGRFDFIQEGEG